jgi:hypothetical protein
MFGMLLRSILVMLGGVQRVPVRHFGMVRGLFVIAGMMMLGGFTMVLGRMLMMMRGFLVMLVNFVIAHRLLPCSIGKVEHCRVR